MGNRNIKKTNQVQISNSSVLNYSLESNKVSIPNSLIIDNDKNEDIIKDLKELDLPLLKMNI